MDILPISKQNKLLLISNYIGSSCFVKEKEIYSFIQGINWVTQSVLVDNESVDPDNVVLVLNNLEEASDFDCTMLSCINLATIVNIDELQLITYGKRIISAYLNHGNIGGFSRIWESLSYLKIKNYAIPYLYMENDIVRIASVKDLLNQEIIMFK